MEVENSILRDLVSQQQFNEALIRMMVLLYQADGKVTLTEQDFFNDTIEEMHWYSGIALPAFINQVIHDARQALDSQLGADYLKGLANELNIDAATAFEVAMSITAVDGKRSDEELELLSLLSNKILARGLVAES
ncbi:TerB family tellurite resistance protein [Glaciecola sp. 1036]|uniref:TerB family tellurite resistance protein n=1 Tax=Alteromonadaceae TaxID=72275 RepID=UPI003D01051B